MNMNSFRKMICIFLCVVLILPITVCKISALTTPWIPLQPDEEPEKGTDGETTGETGEETQPKIESELEKLESQSEETNRESIPLEESENGSEKIGGCRSKASASGTVLILLFTFGVLFIYKEWHQEQLSQKEEI